MLFCARCLGCDLVVECELWALLPFGSDLAGGGGFGCLRFHGHALYKCVCVLDAG